MIEIDPCPLQVAQLAGSQPMPEGEQDHGLVAMRPAIVLAGFDQLLDLSRSVRYSRILTSTSFGRRGVTFRFTAVSDTIFRAGFVV